MFIVSVEWSMQKALAKPHNRMKIITGYDLSEKLVICIKIINNKSLLGFLNKTKQNPN